MKFLFGILAFAPLVQIHGKGKQAICKEPHAWCGCSELGCSLKSCKKHCYCFPGGCIMTKCTEGCECFAPGCTMPKCEKNCRCFRGDCGAKESCKENCEFDLWQYFSEEAFDEDVEMS